MSSIYDPHIRHLGERPERPPPPGCIERRHHSESPSLDHHQHSRTSSNSSASSHLSSQSMRDPASNSQRREERRPDQHVAQRSVGRRRSDGAVRSNGRRRSGHRNDNNRRHPDAQYRRHLEEVERQRRRNPEQRRSNNTQSSRVRRGRPVITIVSAQPMFDHPAFADGDKGGFIPPEAPPSYEQAMRTSAPLNPTFTDPNIPDHISEVRRVFLRTQIAHCDAITVPSYSSTVASQTIQPTTTVTSSPSSLRSANCIVTSPLVNNSTSVTSLSPSPRQRNINHNNSAHPSPVSRGSNQGKQQRAAEDATPSTSSQSRQKPALPVKNPVLRPKPRTLIKSSSENLNNSSNKDEDTSRLTLAPSGASLLNIGDSSASSSGVNLQNLQGNSSAFPSSSNSSNSVTPPSGKFSVCNDAKRTLNCTHTKASTSITPTNTETVMSSPPPAPMSHSNNDIMSLFGDDMAASSLPGPLIPGASTQSHALNKGVSTMPLMDSTTFNNSQSQGGSAYSPSVPSTADHSPLQSNLSTSVFNGANPQGGSIFLPPSETSLLASNITPAQPNYYQGSGFLQPMNPQSLQQTSQGGQFQNILTPNTIAPARGGIGISLMASKPTTLLESNLTATSAGIMGDQIAPKKSAPPPRPASAPKRSTNLPSTPQMTQQGGSLSTMTPSASVKPNFDAHNQSPGGASGYTPHNVDVFSTANQNLTTTGIIQGGLLSSTKPSPPVKSANQSQHLSNQPLGGAGSSTAQFIDVFSTYNQPSSGVSQGDLLAPSKPPPPAKPSQFPTYAINQPLVGANNSTMFSTNPSATAGQGGLLSPTKQTSPTKVPQTFKEATNQPFGGASGYTPQNIFSLPDNGAGGGLLAPTKPPPPMKPKLVASISSPQNMGVFLASHSTQATSGVVSGGLLAQPVGVASNCSPPNTGIFSSADQTQTMLVQKPPQGEARNPPGTFDAFSTDLLSAPNQNQTKSIGGANKLTPSTQTDPIMQPKPIPRKVTTPVVPNLSDTGPNPKIEPVYAAVINKNKQKNRGGQNSDTAPSSGTSLIGMMDHTLTPQTGYQKKKNTPPSGASSLLDMFEPTKNELISSEIWDTPPPLPATRPPLEDLEDLLTPAEMEQALAEREKARKTEVSRGMDTPNQDYEELLGLGTNTALQTTGNTQMGLIDPVYESGSFKDNGLPHVNQTVSPPLLPAPRKKKGSKKDKSDLGLKPPPLPKSRSVMLEGTNAASNASDGSKDVSSPDANIVMRKKSEDGDKSMRKRLRRTSMKLKLGMGIFKQQKQTGEEGNKVEKDNKIIKGESSKNSAKPPPAKPARPPSRPGSLPKRSSSNLLINNGPPVDAGPSLLDLDSPVIISPAPVLVAQSLINIAQPTSVVSETALLDITQSTSNIAPSPATVLQPTSTILPSATAVHQSSITIAQSPVLIAQSPTSNAKSSTVIMQPQVGITQSPFTIVQSTGTIAQPPTAIMQLPGNIAQSPATIAQSPVIIMQSTSPPKPTRVRPAKPPPPKIIPSRPAPARPPPRKNSNHNNCTPPSGIHNPNLVTGPSPKPRSNSRNEAPVTKKSILGPPIRPAPSKPQNKSFRPPPAIPSQKRINKNVQRPVTTQLPQGGSITKQQQNCTPQGGGNILGQPLFESQNDLNENYTEIDTGNTRESPIGINKKFTMGNTKEVNKRSTKDVTKGRTNEVTTENTNRVTTGNTKGVSTGRTNKVTTGNTKGDTKGRTNEVTTGNTKGDTKGSTNKVTTGNTKGVTTGRTNKVTLGKTDSVQTAIAVYDFNNGADDELIFKVGDKITNVSVIDDNWFRGEHNGKTGIFPRGFVAIETGSNLPGISIEPEVASLQTSTKTIDILSYSDWGDDLLTPSSDLEEPMVSPPSLHAEVDPRSDTPSSDMFFDASEDWTNTNSDVTTDTILVAKKNDLVSTKTITRSTDVTIETAMESLNHEKVTPVDNRTALFAFTGEDDSELSFVEGAVITITGKVDDDWLTGELDGHRGIFPAAYVQEEPLGGSAETETTG